MTPHSICEDCLEKQQRIDQLLEENSRLKTQLRYRDNKRKVSLAPRRHPPSARSNPTRSRNNSPSVEVSPKATRAMDEEASTQTTRLESSIWVWMRLAPTVADPWKIRASVTGRF